MKVIPSDKIFKDRKEKVTDKLCADCNSLCCHDLVMEISKPKNEEELKTLKWYLYYENRHDICTKHSPPKCERYEEWYDVIFDDQYELEKYVYEKKIIKKKSSKSPKKISKKVK